MKLHILLLWILLCSNVTEGIDPITSFCFSPLYGSTCLFLFNIAYEYLFPSERCGYLFPFSGRCEDLFPSSGRPWWISFNESGLKADLDNKLFGQPIAADIIFKAVRGFMRNNNPKKPLVLSLHGPTGTGKSFVSQLIADNIYEKGKDSQFVHLFSASHHFPHKGQVETYKSQLQEWIKGNVTNCERSMFIFDDMDIMPPGLIDVIKPYLDFYANVDGVSFRKSSSSFSGADEITQTALDFWKKGRDRDEITLKDLEKSLSESVFNNNEHGFFHSKLIDSDAVDGFIPFLPLEYSHVVECVMVEMKASGLQPDKAEADKVARDLVYFLEPENLFAKNGCNALVNRMHFYHSD